VATPAARVQEGWEHPKPPAPGDLAIVQMFVNSDDLGDGTDEYATADGVTRWLRAAGLLHARERADETDRRRAIQLRATLRALLLANHDGEEVDDRDAARALERVARQAGLEARFGGPEGAHLEPTASGVSRSLGLVVAAVYGAMRDGTWARMKACRSDECLWAFYDHSRNRSGAWCQMETCGATAKMRAYRQRQACRL
jgi:predicted RNA-binding Zn ribbon-like protein